MPQCAFRRGLVGMLLLLPVVGVLYWMLKKIFFFLIDVVPTRGANLTEAQAGVVSGRGVWLGLKSDRDIGNWSDDDTFELGSLINWRAVCFSMRAKGWRPEWSG